MENNGIDSELVRLDEMNILKTVGKEKERNGQKRKEKKGKGDKLFRSEYFLVCSWSSRQTKKEPPIRSMKAIDRTKLRRKLSKRRKGREVEKNLHFFQSLE